MAIFFALFIWDIPFLSEGADSPSMSIVSTWLNTGADSITSTSCQTSAVLKHTGTKFGASGRQIVDSRDHAKDSRDPYQATVVTLCVLC